MIKAVFHLNRKDEETTLEEFKSRWLNEHASIGKNLPKLQRYTISFPDDPDESPYDGMGEIHFESHEDLNAALESDPGTEALADLEHFADTDGILQMVVEQNTIVDQT